MTGWSATRKALTTLGLAGLERTGGESPASLLAMYQCLFREFFEIAVEPHTVGTIFVCGGHDQRGYVSTSEIFTVSKNEWRDAPDLPEPREEHGIAFVDGRVFVFGGRISGGPTNTCVTFSISRNKWEVIPLMSIVRSQPGVAVVGDRIFVIGGRDNDGDTLESVEVYKVSGNTWTAPGVVAPMPTPRFNFGVAVIGNRIFTFGGWNRGELSTVEVHDTETNTWTKLSPMPTARSGMAVAVIGHQIWCFGGFDGRYLDVMEVFDVDKNEWTTSKFKMTSPRNEAKAVVIDGMIWIIGGDSHGEPIDLVEIFDPETGMWTIAPCMHTPRFGHAAIAF
ncbi:MAG: kelch repeat-containing protein [Candidatus Omnitrophota bacterium]